ncbi:uncharacterized protein [Triticum aestivum]|uniref:uncharacterized protein n=1 Tax=Triticum aestivum TaxID=4565 RepID=UPI001D029D09|nr:uncharacterized protein LOC123184322 [Triticum aestivum]
MHSNSIPEPLSRLPPIPLSSQQDPACLLLPHAPIRAPTGARPCSIAILETHLPRAQEFKRRILTSPPLAEWRALSPHPISRFNLSPAVDALLLRCRCRWRRASSRSRVSVDLSSASSRLRVRPITAQAFKPLEDPHHLPGVGGMACTVPSLSRFNLSPAVEALLPRCRWRRTSSGPAKRDDSDDEHTAAVPSVSLFHSHVKYLKLRRELRFVPSLGYMSEDSALAQFCPLGMLILCFGTPLD